MPFTFSHPVAAIPLSRPLGRFGVLSALFVGSLSPDLAYFLALPLGRSVTHSLPALFWFCLPGGLATYVVFHTFMKGPLLGLLPQVVLSRLGAEVTGARSLPRASAVAVVISVLVGAVTHIVWDSFTHTNNFGVTLFPMLAVELFAVGTYTVYVYRALQHGSSVAGLVVLAWWSWRWLMKRPVQAASLPVTLTRRRQVAAIAAMVGVSATVSLFAGILAIGDLTGTEALERFVGGVVFTGLPVLTAAVLAYSAVWQIWCARARAARATRV